jgi:hypothetical protein
MTSATAITHRNRADSLDLKATPKDPGFQALDLPKGTEVSQALKASQGSRLTEPFRVAGALVGSVFRAAYQIYDNARTDIRVGNAAKEMAKFDPAKIATGASAKEILDTWSKMAQQNSRVKSHMETLGGAAGKIVGASRDKLEQLRSDITSILERPVKEGIALKDCVGESGASHIKSLTTEQKKAFVAAYGELRGKLSDLNSLSRKVEDQAKAFYESSVERFQAQDSFKTSRELGAEAMTFYRRGLGTLHKEHVKALKALAAKDAKPDQIREVGKEFTAKIKELNEKTAALSASLKQAATIEGKVTETLKYLTDGVGGSTAVGRPDKSVVFVSAEAAEKIAGWVKAQTKEATELLEQAKNKKDPAAIIAATEKLSAASEVVHKQLSDIATLLSKVNGGLDAEKNPTQDQKERILAKTKDAGVTDSSSFNQGLSDYVGLLKSEMEERIETMFTAKADGSYDLAEGRKGLAVIDKYDDMLERAIEEAKAGGLTPNEVKQSVEKIHGLLRDELSPPTARPARTRIDDIVDMTVAAKEKAMEPKKPSVFSRFAKWWANN